MIKKLEKNTESYIQFTEEELESLGIEKDAKFRIEHDGKNIKLIPYKKIAIDLKKLRREDLEFLIIRSCEEQKSIEEVIEECLVWYIEALENFNNKG